ncbi:MAG: TolC family protein [Candidatus Binatia bacterium]
MDIVCYSWMMNYNLRQIMLVLVVVLLCPLAWAADTAENGESPFLLAEAIAQARRVSPLRRAAEARVEAAIGGRYQAGRLPNPVLDIRGENLPFRGGGGAPLDQTVDVFAVLSQPIETGGKRTARQAIAEAAVEGARAASEQAEQRLTLEVMHLYLAALRAYRLAEIITTGCKEMQTVLGMMRRRVEEGHTAEADLRRLEVEAGRLELELGRARLDFDRNAAALGMMVGVAEPIGGGRLVEPAMVDAPRGDARELAEKVVSKHPEVLAARARVEQARRAVELERARRLPDISLIAGYKRSGGDDTVVAGVVVPLPFFDRNFGNIERAQAEEQAAMLDLDALRAQLTVETVTLVRTAQELSKYAEDAQKQILEPAGVARSAARAAFREGVGSLLQLVDAERAYADAHREVLTLRLDAYERVVRARFLVLGEEVR